MTPRFFYERKFEYDVIHHRMRKISASRGRSGHCTGLDGSEICLGARDAVSTVRRSPESARARAQMLPACSICIIYTRQRRVACARAMSEACLLVSAPQRILGARHLCTCTGLLTLVLIKTACRQHGEDVSPCCRPIKSGCHSARSREKGTTSKNAL